MVPCPVPPPPPQTCRGQLNYSWTPLECSAEGVKTSGACAPTKRGMSAEPACRREAFHCSGPAPSSHAPPSTVGPGGPAPKLQAVPVQVLQPQHPPPQGSAPGGSSGTSSGAPKGTGSEEGEQHAGTCKARSRDTTGPWRRGQSWTVGPPAAHTHQPAPLAVWRPRPQNTLQVHKIGSPRPLLVQRTTKSSTKSVQTGVFVGHTVRYPINSVPKPGPLLIQVAKKKTVRNGSVRWTRRSLDLAGGGG